LFLLSDIIFLDEFCCELFVVETCKTCVIGFAVVEYALIAYWLVLSRMRLLSWYNDAKACWLLDARLTC